MTKKVSLALVMCIILVLLIASVVQAQEVPPNEPLMGENDEDEVRGSIRGKVYADQNGDGVCSGTQDPAAVGIPVEFTSSDGQHTLYLQSGDDGTYGLVAAGLGTWTVTIRPPENYVATSRPAVQVTLTAEQRLVTGVDFCVRQRGIPGGPGFPPGRPGGPGYGGGPGGPPGPYHPPVLLPESGAAAQSTTSPNIGLWIAGLVGVMFVGLGLVVAAKDRIKKI